MPDFLPPPGVLTLSRRLEESGFESWCVGGAIRDALLGGSPLDWDLATSATPTQVQSLFGRKRTIPVGIEFGTVCVLDDDRVPHEITTFRRDVTTDGRHAVVEFGASLDDDLARRDFTINAIAFRPRTGEVRDPFDGRGDIERRIVRAVGDAEQRMREDRLRALRAIRFAARYQFSIEPETMVAIRASARHLTRLSAERVQQELVKTMQQVERPGLALALWRETGALAVLVPALASIDDVALDTLDRLPRAAVGRGAAATQRTSNRLAALCLDVAPAATRRMLVDLRFSKHEISWAAGLGERWALLGHELAAVLLARRPEDVEVRRWVARLGRLQAGPFLRVALARWQALRAHGRPAPTDESVRALHRRVRRTLYRDPLELADLRMDGDDLRRAGIPAGPIYAKILSALLDRVLEDPARNTPEALVAELPSIVAGLGGSAEQPVHHSSDS